jgi:hypothetical protein
MVKLEYFSTKLREVGNPERLATQRGWQPRGLRLAATPAVCQGWLLAPIGSLSLSLEDARGKKMLEGNSFQEKVGDNIPFIRGGVHLPRCCWDPFGTL